MGSRSRVVTVALRDWVWVCACGALLACTATESPPGGGAGTNAPIFPSTAAGAGGSGGSTTPPQAGRSGGAGATVMTQGGTGGGTPTSGAGGMPGTAGGGGMGAGGAMATAGMGGMDGAAGATAGAGGSSGTTRTSKPPCLTAGSQGVFIGDSYVNYINSLAPLVASRARMAGALPTGQNYRDVAVAGTSLNYGFGPIPSQWDGIARGASVDVNFVIMTGGGNDVLINNSYCLAAGSDQDTRCQMVAQESLKTLNEMWASMKMKNVADVIFFYYPHVPYGGEDVLDWVYPMMKSQCEAQNTATYTCHFIDLRPLFEGHGDYIGIDQIHPTATGAGVIADELWKTMMQKCIGQNMSSGCCMAK
jgi:GDSL-like Lipase/Acylhydrolase family